MSKHMTECEIAHQLPICIASIITADLSCATLRCRGCAARDLIVFVRSRHARPRGDRVSRSSRDTKTLRYSAPDCVLFTKAERRIRFLGERGWTQQQTTYVILQTNVV